MQRLARLLPGDVLALLRAVGRVARVRGENAYLVGGAVRDLLLGRPSLDIDVVVEGDAARLARALAQSSGGSVRIHDAFGTASLVTRDGLALDLAGARSERYDAPAALPRVTPADIVQDLRRRDFTINAIAVALDPDGFGRVVDPHGGRRDIRERKIRILHDRSFLDDPTRTLRAARFAARLGFALESATRARLRSAVRGGGLDGLSSARLRREIERGLGDAHPAATVRELARHGLLVAVHPSLLVGAGALARLRRHEASQARHPAPHGWAVALAVLASDAGRADREALAARLAPDRRVRSFLVEGPRSARRVCARLTLPSAARASFIHRVCQPEAADVLGLAAAIAPSGPVAERIERFLDELRSARTEIRGEDLLRAGIPPGPRVALGLAAALRAKLDGRAPDARAQLRIALAAAGNA